MAQQQVQLSFGCFEPELKDQLKTFELDAEKIEVLQKDANAVTRLYVRGLITPSQTQAARKKLISRVKAFIKETQSARSNRKTEDDPESAGGSAAGALVDGQAPPSGA